MLAKVETFQYQVEIILILVEGSGRGMKGKDIDHRILLQPDIAELPPGFPPGSLIGNLEPG
jgi:hypothetical protein